VKYSSIPSMHRLSLHLQVELDPIRWARAAVASSSVRRIKSCSSSLNLVPFGNPRFRASTSSSTSVSFYQQRSQFAKMNDNNKNGPEPVLRTTTSHTLTTTRDFFTPKTASLERNSSPSGYSDVTTLRKPGASIITWR
jgi:hypothetical protein